MRSGRVKEDLQRRASQPEEAHQRGDESSPRAHAFNSGAAEGSRTPNPRITSARLAVSGRMAVGEMQPHLITLQ